MPTKSTSRTMKLSGASFNLPLKPVAIGLSPEMLENIETIRRAANAAGLRTPSVQICVAAALKVGAALITEQSAGDTVLAFKQYTSGATLFAN